MTRPSSPTFDAPYLLELRSSKSFILLTVCAAIFTDSFLYGVLIPVIPFTLHHRSGIPESDVQWWTSVILAGYGLMVLIGSPISGYYADHSTNRRKPFFLGLLSLSVGTVLFGVATNIYVLVVSRMLQGLSAAVVYSVGLAVLTDTVDREEIGAWMGTALSSNSVGLVVSPILGGLVYRTLGYGAVFAMASTMIVIDIVLRVLMVERKTAEQFRCSEVQSIQVGETVAYGTFPSPQTHETHAIEDPKARSKTPSVVTTSSTSANHQTTALPALLILLSSRRLLASLYGSLVNFTILVSFDATLPLFVFRTFNWSSLGAGLVFLALTIPALAGPLVGRLSDKFGPRWIAVAGCILTAPGLVSLRFVDHDSTKQIVLFCFLLTLIGSTLILIISPLAADLSFVAEEKARLNPLAFGPGGAYAQAYSLFNCSMAVGVLFGPLLVGWLVEKHGYGVAMLVLGVFSLSGAVPCMIFTGGPLVCGKWKGEVVHEAEEEGGDLEV